MIKGQYWIIECKNITLNYSIKEVSENESLTKYINIKKRAFYLKNYQF